MRDPQKELDKSTSPQYPTCRGSPSCELDERAQGKLIASPSLSSQSADPGGFVPASIFERDLITPPLIQGPATGYTLSARLARAIWKKGTWMFILGMCRVLLLLQMLLPTIPDMESLGHQTWQQLPLAPFLFQLYQL